MNDFIFYNPDRVYFGKTALDNLAQGLKNMVKRCFWYTVAVR